MIDHDHDDTAVLVGRLTAAVDEQQGRVAQLRGELGTLRLALATFFAQPVRRADVDWTLDDFARLTAADEGRAP